MTRKHFARTTFLLTLSLALAVGLWGALPMSKAMAQAAGDYRSAATGNWGDASTWERYDGSSWVPAVAPPSSADGVITIRNGHTVTVAANVTVDQVVVEAGGQVTVASGATFTTNDGSGNELTIYGTFLHSGTVPNPMNGTGELASGGTYIHNTTSSASRMLNFFGSNIAADSNFIYRDTGTAVSLSGRTYGNLNFETTSSWTFTAGTGTSPLTVQGNFTIGSGVTFNIGSFTGAFYVASNWSNNGSFGAGTGTVTFNGTSAQTIGGSSATTFNNLTIDNASGVTLNTAATVNGILTLTSGLLTLGDNDLTLGPAATIGGTPSASNMVVTNGNGFLYKTFSALGSFTYPIGDNTGTAEYSPAILDFTSGSFSGVYIVGVRVVNSKHWLNASTTHYIDRYWAVDSGGITNFRCNVTFQYVPADVHGTEALIYGAQWNWVYWRRLDAADTVNHRLTGSAASFSDFTGGEEGPTAVTLTAATAAPGAGAAGALLLALGLAAALPLGAFVIRRRRA